MSIMMISSAPYICPLSYVPLEPHHIHTFLCYTLSKMPLSHSLGFSMLVLIGRQAYFLNLASQRDPQYCCKETPLLCRHFPKTNNPAHLWYKPLLVLHVFNIGSDAFQVIHISIIRHLFKHSLASGYFSFSVFTSSAPATDFILPGAYPLVIFLTI